MAEFVGRRLPVYLVLDCSGSMTGEPIEAARQDFTLLAEDGINVRIANLDQVQRIAGIE